MGAQGYVNILSFSLESMNLSEFIFQQDNNLKHTASVKKHFFEPEQKDSAMSPDMNPIENLWDHVKEHVAEF